MPAYLSPPEPFLDTFVSRLWADTRVELLQMGGACGIGAKLLQKACNDLPEHFNLMPKKRRQALALGALEVDEFAFAEAGARNLNDIDALQRIAMMRARKEHDEKTI